jgi:hypothetical protein
MNKRDISGILMIYNHPLVKNAPTIMEHVDAFEKHSSFKVWKVNTECGFPKRLGELRFKAIILHYSLFGYKPFMTKGFLDYLEASKHSYKIAFFQDEHRFCKMRFGFINHYKVDCVFTLIEPDFFNETYHKYTDVPRLVYCLPGYVSDSMLEVAHRYFVPDDKRRIDIGYRGRNLEYYMGKGALEKYEIGVEFKEKASGLGLKLDIEVEESKRIYGKNWYRFVANSRGVLGVEAGVSIFDVEDVVYEAYQRLIANSPRMSYEKMSERLHFCDWEDKIYYRTISPRHFEAAAFRVCQILFEGKYSGLMKPRVHYIPLKKDFSNFNEVIQMFKDHGLRKELTENAYNDLVANGDQTYKRFVESSFDPVLLEAGLEPDISPTESEEVTGLLDEDYWPRQMYGKVMGLRRLQFPGRSLLVPVVKPMLQKYEEWRHRTEF